MSKVIGNKVMYAYSNKCTWCNYINDIPVIIKMCLLLHFVFVFFVCFPLIFVVQEIKVKYTLGLDMNDDKKKKEWDVK